MINAEEREQYIKKLSSQISGMNELLNPKYQEIISGSVAGEIKKLLTKAENLKRKLSENEFEIAIVGVEKAGKSTFANALMGNDILPSMEARCTYTSTVIRYGTDDFAEVVFFSRDEFRKRFSDNLRTMGIEHSGNYDFSSLPLDKYRELFDQLPDEKKNLYRANVNEDIENILENKNTLIHDIGSETKIYRGAQQLESFEFKKYIQEPAYAVAVKKITIHSSRLTDMPNAVIYDVPGFDSPTQIHREQTVQMMSGADVIIMIADASKPSITGPQVQIFESEVDADGIPFNEKIFIFGNRADRVNDSIEKNIGILKSQLEKYRIVRSELIEKRITVGSARARLEMEGKIENTGACENLKTRGISDGIDEIHSRLEQYNNTERFEILKKRINRIYNELEECLAPQLEILNDSSENYINIGSISGIAINLLNSAQNSIRTRLSSLHSEVPKVFSTLPLSNKFLECISSVNSENYMVSEEEKISAANESGTTGANISIDKFESSLRKTKYNQIYDYFIKTVVDLAIETHNEYDEKITNIFLESLSVTKSNPYYEELSGNVRQYLCSINPESREGYYRSLAERFATDLFETLIRQNFGGRDRWSAYDDRKLNLFSLSIFHTENNPGLPADRQPMLYSILFHDNPDISPENYDVSELLGIISGYVPGHEQEVADKFTGILRKVIAVKKRESVVYIKYLCTRREGSVPNRFISSLLRYLENEFEDDCCETNNSSAPAITLSYYNERCKSEDLNSNDCDIVCSHLHKDIDILGDILLKAVIPAIQIDKAFVYYCVRCIENILATVEPGEQYRFGAFVTQNTAKIACGELAEIEVEEKKRRLRQEICSEINKILGDVRCCC